MSNAKESVRLRQRPTPSGNISLYLDIYRNGKRKYEYLKMYLIPEKTKSDKDKNRETLRFAEAVKAKRIVEMQNNEYGFRNTEQEQANFMDYYKEMCAQRISTDSRGNYGTWMACLKHLERYDSNLSKRTFSDITPQWVKGFKSYLENVAQAWECDARRRSVRKMSRNSISNYFTKLNACILQAVRDGIITKNPMNGIGGIKGEDVSRMYLTMEEVKLLAQTECKYPGIKRAFLFSCLTGLRKSDVLRLTWGDVQQQGAFTRIVFRQKKTKGQEYLDINGQAAELMGKRGSNETLVFQGMPENTTIGTILAKWVKDAGINKHITFHCARHTFAVMMLDLGVDIYTVSKLLGHRELATTQVYAKVLDKNKQKAVESIPTIFK